MATMKNMVQTLASSPVIAQDTVKLMIALAAPTGTKLYAANIKGASRAHLINYLTADRDATGAKPVYLRLTHQVRISQIAPTWRPPQSRICRACMDMHGQYLLWTPDLPRMHAHTRHFHALATTCTACTCCPTYANLRHEFAAHACTCTANT